MNNQFSANTETSWTWADQISTYRFWGLLIFYLLSLVAFTTLSSNLAVFLVREIGTQISEIGIIFSVMAVGGLLGFYLAWATTRWKTVPILIFAGILQLLGGLLVTIPNLTSLVVLRLAGAFIIGLGSGIITLAIPSAIAGGRGGAEMFVISFGLIIALTRIGELYGTVFMGLLWQWFNSPVLGIVISVYLFIGLLFLLPVRHSLFIEPPPQRSYPLPPTQRDPFIVAISCLIPFYWLYWLYRAHGEITSLAPSRTILSPRASVMASIFIPFFIYPVIVTTLNDALNKRAAKLGKPVYRASWVIFVSSFLFFPITMALIQSTMNRVMTEINLQQQAA